MFLATFPFLCWRDSAHLIASYALNESSWTGTAPQVHDSTGNGHGGTAIGGVNTVSDSLFGRAGRFNGNSQYVALGGSRKVLGARSIVAWVKPDAFTDRLGLPILTGGTKGTGDFFAISGTGGEDSGLPQYELYVDRWYWGPYHSSGTNALVTPNKWNQVAMTYDGGTVKFYINGLPAGTCDSSFPMYNYDFASYTLGGNTIGGSTTLKSFRGQMADVRIYDSALAPPA